ncbi:hypothetical protein HGA01_04110 [Gordonia amicalis]|nr:hypothetical protein [Gordonia amicalis]NKX76813.1 hypothetical protein [Gordonia amicalis]GAC54099.1 hypothetical protein GOAMI_27_00460 [Gordonia amicalis NBRC 100051 = JCM 11271]
MITTTRILDALPRSRLFGRMRDYHRARPGHSSRPQTIVSGIQEQDPRDVPGDILAEWDVQFHAATRADPNEVIGDVLACRVLRRARHSRTTVLDPDSHPVILLADDVPRDHAGDVWEKVMRTVQGGGTLSDVLFENQRREP